MNKNVIIFLLISFSTLLTFCSKSTLEPEKDVFDLRDTITINYKQILYNIPENLSIKFETLVTDSRCPVDVICVWEGDAELEFVIRNNNNVVNFSLHTAGNYFNRDTVLFGYRIELLDVYPYPHSEKVIELENYKVKLVIDKALD